MLGRREEVSTPGQTPSRLWGASPTDGGGQSSEFTLSEWPKGALSLVKENTQQYHLLRGEKGLSPQRGSPPRQGGWDRQGLSTKLNHVHSSLSVCNNQGKPEHRTHQNCFRSVCSPPVVRLGPSHLPSAPARTETLLHPGCLQVTPVEIQASY